MNFDLKDHSHNWERIASHQLGKVQPKPKKKRSLDQLKIEVEIEIEIK